MNPFEYDEAKRQAELLNKHIHDYIGDESNPYAQRLVDLSQDIENKLSSKENPRAIEQTVEKILIEIRAIDEQQELIIVSSRTNWLIDQYENLQMSLRKFENY